MSRHKSLLLLTIFLVLTSTTYAVWEFNRTERKAEFITPEPVASSSGAWRELFNQPLTMDEIPNAGIYKFGTKVDYVYGLMVTINAPKDGKFTVELDAPNGWVVDSDDETQRSQVYVSMAGDPKFECSGPFSEDLLPGTEKIYDCTVKDFGKDATDYIGVMAAQFVIPMWNKTATPF